ncbi:ricin-type beta-trefoil lectin domain protein [Amycolatopsis rhabdoformis]|uniref:Ricin-type beta-trefoil lectin domain protein n=1 Tax=Amycolatopsis rhabdoformis TaxID=1448059 RepID=A0ABZ1ID57_9PSEU|nr:ricin-type beta-trefoil lectin domain protein [Amycolatopsis rhabdoformis]WSE31986.1 ricin-type beta-trefoil lectin domain protein [Amycolatopsis rhabdoformis]
MSATARQPRSARRRFAVAAVVATASAAASLTALAPAAQAATTASVWLTTPDRANLLTQQGNVAFGSGGSGPVITVNPNATYQSMVGFGASFTDASAWNITNSPRRDEIMNALFDTSSGIGLSFLRQPIGASDFSRSFYTYDDGAADPSLSRFTVAHDNAYILPLVKQAKSLNPKLSVMATPWSGPAWMKDNNNLIGGSLRNDQIGVFSDYLVKFAQAYGAAGVPIDYLSVQNEPRFPAPGYPSMTMDANQQADIINTLAPKLRAAGLPAKILGYDHNWDVTDFAEQVNNQAGGNVAGSAWHCYGGDPSAQSKVWNDQHKDVFFTECSGHDSDNVASTFADTLRWQGMNLTIGATRNYARTVATWNLALDNNHGPVIGSCGNCTGVATVSGGTVSYNAEYYVLGHLSKFVKPGAVRIDSTGYGEGGIENVAFRNPDGTIVLVALNTGGTQNFQVSYGGQSFGYQLPAGSMATFTWPGTGGGTTTPPPTGRTGPISGLGGKCLDVTGGSTVNGNQPQLWDCTSGPNQQWTLSSDGTVRALGKCLDVTGNGTADGTAVQLWDCFGAPNQKWSAGANGSLVNAGSSKCLDVKDGGTANGTKLQIWTCSGGPNQRWSVPA